jgi:kynurenine formamidase
MLVMIVSLLLGLNAEAALPNSTISSQIDVYEPKTKPLATVIFLHGGAWVGGDKSSYKNLAPTFTIASFRFVSANYRLAPASRHPAPIDDLENILTNKSFGDIFLIGHSAGAHLIAFWNAAHANTKVRGFIGLEGIYDIPSLIKVWPAYRDQFISAEFGNDPSRWSAASPTQLSAKNKSPWLVIHSEKDELVDLAQSQEFVTHLEGQKIPVQLLKLKTESHFRAVQALEDPTSVAAKAVLKFISANLR